MARTEIKVGGLGGQGIILTGAIIGKAASIFDTKYATMTQAFGPEARGSACSAQVIVSDERILYPYVTNPDILIVLSQDAFEKFVPGLKDGGLLVYDDDMVTFTELGRGIRTISVPATRFAEELGKKQCTNTVMVGFFAAVGGVIEPDALRKAVEDSVPERTIELNMRAFEKGLGHGKNE